MKYHDIGRGDDEREQAAFGYAQDQPRISDEHFEDAGVQPAPRLLVDDVLGRQVLRQPGSGRTSMHDPAQGIEDLAQVVVPLRRVRTDQGEVGGDEGPLLATDIAGGRAYGQAVGSCSADPQATTRSTASSLPALKIV